VENANKLKEIFSLLQRCPISAKIVAFFLEHKFAMDTARGIAEWWIERDPDETQDALHCLVSYGVVVMKTYAGINLYSFTTNRHLQNKLREYFQGMTSP
jgi:hypothetical protein